MSKWARAYKVLLGTNHDLKYGGYRATQVARWTL